MLKPDALVEAGVIDVLAPALEHGLADVDADDLRLGRMGQRDRHTGGPGGHVENAPRLEARDVADDLATPPPVLPQRKHLGQAVVARRQILEEIGRERVLRARGRRAGL